MKLFYLSSLVLLAACTSNAPVHQKSSAGYDSQSQARIRLYGQNGKPSYAYTGIDCDTNRKGTKIGVGGSLGDAFGSLVGASSSQSMGIPETEISKNVGKMNGLASRAFFREFAVEAGKPVNAQTFYIGLTNTLHTETHTITQYEGSCSSNIASFIPQAGHDYEIVGSKGRSCGVSVFEVGAQGELTPVAVDAAVQCKHRRKG
nr:hypothetical protein [uncultured Kingella sp.]